MFEVKGFINNKDYTLKYSGGILTGDGPALEKARAENKKDYGYLGPALADYNINYLKHELSAYSLITRFVFEKVTKAKDDWPEDEPGTIH